MAGWLLKRFIACLFAGTLLGLSLCWIFRCAQEWVAT